MTRASESHGLQETPIVGRNSSVTFARDRGIYKDPRETNKGCFCFES